MKRKTIPSSNGVPICNFSEEELIVALKKGVAALGPLKVMSCFQDVIWSAAVALEKAQDPASEEFYSLAQEFDVMIEPALESLEQESEVDPPKYPTNKI